VLHGVTLGLVPTTRPRHTITETPAVQQALDELRVELGPESLDVPDLVIRGARDKLAEVRRDRPDAVEARTWLAARIRERALSADPAAADEAKRAGLIELDAPTR
jgi:hypothetical protein